jgi:hypothetical protein
MQVSQTLVRPQDCMVGNALALHCGYATNEIETKLQACSHAAAEMRRRTTCTHAHTHIHMHRRTHTGAHTHRHTFTHAQAHTRVHTHTL